MNSALDVQHISKSYGKKQAVKDVSFRIQEGEIFGLMGMNGAGKTTILRMLATLLRPDAGDALIAGTSIVQNPEKVRAYISYLPDEAGAYKTMTGKNYLKFIAGLYFKDEKEQKECVALGEEICGLGDALSRKINTYSRGMTRKLVLARTVMTKPKLAILDEPTSGLDVLNSLDIRKTIRRCAEEYREAGDSMLMAASLASLVPIYNSWGRYDESARLISQYDRLPSRLLDDSRVRKGREI
ncbi:MAG: ABC transporter ATP-binding protein, partial [Oscillospiraceae bacterium]|nr:ABC transporter ATP-binding protein [Oscillospiraceae bacterium]